MDAAINHFIEAGRSLKAIEAAIQCRQFSKAAGIIDFLVGRGEGTDALPPSEEGGEGFGWEERRKGLEGWHHYLELLSHGASTPLVPVRWKQNHRP